MDADEYRRAACEQWSRSAEGWGRHADTIQQWAMEVSRWLIDAARLQPGHVVLEVACGPGDTGLLAAEVVQPGGRAILSDFAEEMVQVARERAAARGADNVEARVLDAEALDLDTASVDAVISRWGYMLMADPAAALQEARRVLRPGGRLALAAWAGPEHNPWATLPTDELAEHGFAPPRDLDVPGMFHFAPPGRVEGLLEDAGFTGIVVEHLELERRHRDADEYVAFTLDLSRPFADALDRMDEPTRAKVLDGVRRRTAERAGPDGEIVLPGRVLVAAAEA